MRAEEKEPLRLMEMKVGIDAASTASEIRSLMRIIWALRRLEPWVSAGEIYE